MSWLFATLFLVSCWTYVQTQDGGMRAVFVPVKEVQKESGEAFLSTMTRSTIPYHPVVRFRAMEVPPVFFYVVDEPPDPEDTVRLTGADIAELLVSVYEEEYDDDEPPPKKVSKSTIRFGIIR